MKEKTAVNRCEGKRQNAQNPRTRPPAIATAVALGLAAAVLAGCVAPRQHSMYPAGDYFFVGGGYEQRGSVQDYRGQMYVQHFAPAAKRFPYPVVMVHGSGQTGNNFLGTPDGRPGWARHFVERGFEVYVVDQPARGRSNTAASYGTYGAFPVPVAQYLLSASSFPQASLPSQWPGGKPVPGNPAFDQFMAQQVAFLDDGSVTERLNLAANVALSKRIGPAVYLNHSQAGAFGWAFADAHPEWVKGLIQVEPNGPPFRDVSLVKGDPWHAFRPGIARAHGITREPLAWAPPLDAGKLPMTEEGSPDFSGAIRCLVQAEPAHKLPNLAKVPILIVTGEASFRATYDHCTAKFLRQAGVPNTHAQLGHEGIRGNSHMMMLELNNEAIADFMTRWLQRSVK